jgi:hypothetical protein
MSGWALFFALCIGHAVADYPLQGDFLARLKQPYQTAINEPYAWLIGMIAHCLTHAGAVWYITGSIGFALAELLLHFAIDVEKCAGRLTFVQDQAAHIACKAAYAAILCPYPMSHLTIAYFTSGDRRRLSKYPRRRRGLLAPSNRRVR